ncbi:MAG: NnrS family protein [Rhodanobacteraceae bacterium]|nr:NnrS family protein [Rhodanobacteraceae bacterium]
MDILRISSTDLPSVRQLAAAPHRLMFFVGALNVLAAMAWWALWLIDARWNTFGFAPPPVHAGWMHAFAMQYQVLPPFIFGFLLTVFPRWMSLKELSRRHYLPVGAGLLSGQLAFLTGLAGFPTLIHAGVIATLIGWSTALAILLHLLWQDRGRTWHGVSCVLALTLGLAGLVLFAFYLYSGDARLLLASIKIGSFGLLLPIYVTVAHRMFPFFAGNLCVGYVAWRPLWFLAAFWVLTLAHLMLELLHAYAWLWLADLPFAALCSLWLWRTWPRRAAPALLQVLFVGYAWLPLALLLYTAQSIGLLVGGHFVLGRAPAHALFIGFFGSVLVAMVTRVTQGHSGRALELGGVAAFAFVLIQLTAALRVIAEVVPDGPFWQALAAAGWLIAFLPWVVRSAWIYLTPRADGRPG